MELEYQQSALNQLKLLSDKDAHSILISGLRGSGKTYCAKQFSRYKNIDTFHSISPKVADLKTAIDSSYQLQDLQVICIENLDDGSNAAAQVILKYLEEPLSNVYVIVTCVNTAKIPDTILSRSISVELEHPRMNELAQYARSINAQKYTAYRDYAVYKTAKTLSDIKQILNLSLDQIKYYEQFSDSKAILSLPSNDIMWMLGHYNDSSKADLKLSLRCLLQALAGTKQAQFVLNSLLAVESNRLSETAVLGSLVLDLKYGD
jgi:DNA polymerase III gamma/tau subunit